MTTLTRIYAGELSRSTLQKDTALKQSPPIIISPSGACGSCLLLAGALTRVEKLPGEFIKAWVSDPTGTFNLSTSRQDEEIYTFLEHADTPVFILCTGELQVSRNSKKEVIIRPLAIRTADRLTRDTWIIRTAEETLKRLEIMECAIRERNGNEVTQKAISHYHVDTSIIRSLVVMVEEALSKANHVPGGEIKLPEPREILLELIKANSGPKGINISELLLLAAGKGIREDQVIHTVRQLVEEDECYQPAAGAVKLL